MLTFQFFSQNFNLSNHLSINFLINLIWYRGYRSKPFTDLLIPIYLPAELFAFCWMLSNSLTIGPIIFVAQIVFYDFNLKVT